MSLVLRSVVVFVCAMPVMACGGDDDAGSPPDAGTPDATPPMEVTCEPGAACECPPGANCEIDCAAGGCDPTCAEGATCTIDCTGGGCDASCADGATCTIVCTDGDCNPTCEANASCTIECDGGGCDPTCEAGSTCVVECAEGECQTHCIDATCTQNCDGGNCAFECTGASTCTDNCVSECAMTWDPQTTSTPATMVRSGSPAALDLLRADPSILVLDVRPFNPRAAWSTTRGAALRKPCASTHERRSACARAARVRAVAAALVLHTRRSEGGPS